MLFQMQIPEMFSYVGMKDTKVSDEVLNILTQKYKMEERVQTEHNLTTQAVYDFFIYIYLLLFHFAFTCTFTCNT